MRDDMARVVTSGHGGGTGIQTGKQRSVLSLEPQVNAELAVLGVVERSERR